MNNSMRTFTSLAPFFRRAVEEHCKQHQTAAPSALLDWAALLLPKHFSRPPSKMHRWLSETLDQLPHQRGTKLNVLAPRASAKSTIAAFAYPLREALTQREPYIWIISDTMSQAHTHLENIKTELETNPLLEEMYPAACGKGRIWRQGTITLRNGVIIEAFGTGQKLRGRKRNENRPALILCDDLQNDHHIISASARERSKNWFHDALLKAGSDRTNVINLATALHREAIAWNLHAKPDWISKTFRAIEKFPINMHLWQEWENIYAGSGLEVADTFYENHRAAMDDGAEVLWDASEPLYALMKMRVSSGYTSFEREKQNSPVNPDLCEFPDAYFEGDILYEKLPEKIVMSVLALDPSKGKDSSFGDYSAFALVSLGEDGIFYVDAELVRLPVTEMIDRGIVLYRQYRPSIFCVEANQFQELLCREFDQKFGRPVVYPVQNHVNKIVRIRQLGRYFSQRRFRFNKYSPGCLLMLEQLRSFPIGSHDDGPDALEMAIRICEAVR